MGQTLRHPYRDLEKHQLRITCIDFQGYTITAREPAYSRGTFGCFSEMRWSKTLFLRDPGPTYTTAVAVSRPKGGGTDYSI